MKDVYIEDCVETMARFDDGSVDLVVTSPPYDDLREYGGHAFDFEQFTRVAEGLARVVKDGGVVVWIVGDQKINRSESGTSFRHALHFMDVGFLLHDTMIWVKAGVPVPAHNTYHQAFEYMFVFSNRGPPETFNPIKDFETDTRWHQHHRSRTRRNRDGTLTTSRRRL